MVDSVIWWKPATKVLRDRSPFLSSTHYWCPAVAIITVSPIDMLFLNSIVIAPIFLFLVHPIPYMINVIYFYYFGVMDHSGIKMESIYPWQPNTTFHDDHHRLALIFLYFKALHELLYPITVIIHIIRLTMHI